MYDKTALNSIKDYLVSHQQTLAVAESVIAGHLQAALSTPDGASDFFQGGITAYNLQQKTKLLHIDPTCGEACNCVSRQTAQEMAVGACNLFSCDWAIAVTGYAAPDKHNEEDYLYAIYTFAYGEQPVETAIIKASGKKIQDNQLDYTNRILEAFSEYLAQFKPGY